MAFVVGIKKEGDDVTIKARGKCALSENSGFSGSKFDFYICFFLKRQ
jgi:hypothetical protein